ncbi:hypothetical protein FD755_008315 [Muntiacus reevesi]|uniref:Rad60/SUMO-like domain-containing protein n=1 Tax=Muntiacus reevesi TaxID=9886 RepID=A0A5J5MMI4_MUNRE|nr:hypothetical protein FD755_008315 [Muntiacus reevesi]
MALGIDDEKLKEEGQDGSEMPFNIKRHTPLSTLIKAYCERKGLSLGVEDEDTTVVFQQQRGGVY